MSGVLKDAIPAGAQVTIVFTDGQRSEGQFVGQDTEGIVIRTYAQYTTEQLNWFYPWSVVMSVFWRAS